MISLILPYFQRQAATDESLRLMALHYFDTDLEVVIVNDGGEPYQKPTLSLDIKVILLSPKTNPLNPCVPYNRGVSGSKGDYIALSNPEILHTEPVLEQMLSECKRDPLNYVMAACWCPDQQRWHAHSSRKRRDDNDVGAYIPNGADYHFLTMMHRSLWDKTGFDEDYRQGAGYDDPDFVRRLHKAGAKFIMRDDLVVQHPRKGARADWTGEMFARNRAIFMSKWEPLSYPASALSGRNSTDPAQTTTGALPTTSI